MRENPLAFAVIIAGLGLAVFSFVWPSLVRWRSPGWTEEQAQAHAEASANLHYLAHTRAHQLEDAHGAVGEKADSHHARQVSDQVLDDARAQYQNSWAALERARHAGEGTAAWMKWIGIALALAGVGGFYYFREKPKS
jgi:hypothetical protein